MTALQVTNVSVCLGQTRVVDRISFALEPGQIGCLLGASGCGKTTLLRAIAGFQSLQQGEISLHGECMSRTGWQIVPEKRRVGMVFQGLALFPHLSVKENIVFGMQDKPAHERKRQCQRLLAMTGLGNLAERFPHQLSGGQQQRVAIARALAPDPDILLMDEPFSSLDSGLREQLAGEIQAIIRQAGITTLLVTHDQMEAFAMADVVGVMAQGRLMQWDNAYQLYHQPANRYVAGFVGQGTWLKGRLNLSGCIDTEIGVLPAYGIPDNADFVDVLVRQDAVIYDKNSSLQAEVCSCVFRGTAYLYTLKLPSGTRLQCMLSESNYFSIGEMIGIRVDANAVRVFIVD